MPALAIAGSEEEEVVEIGGTVDVEVDARILRGKSLGEHRFRIESQLLRRGVVARRRRHDVSGMVAFRRDGANVEPWESR